MPTSRATRDARDETIERLSWGLPVLALLVGGAIIACHLESGGRRWAAASWQFALQVPGAPATWGVVILVAGIAMVVGKLLGARDRFCYRAGTWLAFWWFVVLCAASLLAMFNNGTVNPLSPITWGAIAFAYALLFRLSK